MRKFQLILISVLVGLSNLWAQNYQTVRSDRVAFFNSNEGYVRCISFDSVELVNDSILYPYRNIQQVDHGCVTPYGKSWIGDKILINDKGLNVFFNKNMDSIKINALAKYSDEWIAFTLPDSLFVIAEVINLDTLSFLSINDSVKTIGFKVLDKTMNLINHKLNDQTIQISKEYGFIKTFNFNLFMIPGNETSDYSMVQKEFQEYNLVGLSKPEIGLQNLTWLGVHDYNIGDEIHVCYSNSSWGPDDPRNSYSKRTRLKYLDRINYNKDSIVYKVKREMSIASETQDTSYVNYTYDTIYQVFISDTSFDKLPGEPVIGEWQMYQYYMHNGTVISKIDPNWIEFYELVDHSCWSPLHADGCISTTTYLKGLGGPYYSCSNAFSFGESSNSLYYYKKGNKTWGTPLELTDIKETGFDKELLLYPNPTKGVINIKSDIVIDEVYIYDFTGKKLQFISSSNILNINNFDNGIYLIEFCLPKGKSIIKKIIKE